MLGKDKSNTFLFNREYQSTMFTRCTRRECR